MSRFFFDFADLPAVDDQGVEFASLDEAVRAVGATLALSVAERELREFEGAVLTREGDVPKVISKRLHNMTKPQKPAEPGTFRRRSR